ncbi:MAG: pilus assembly protein PilP [Acidobacteria bacterium]|nr:pilus assembly protein PilP [Acidobacteriota bacterium]
MRRLAAITVLACLVLLVSGCGEETATGPTAADYMAERERLVAQMKKNKAQQPQKQAAAVVQDEAMESGFGAVAATYTYDKKGKRDPFQPYRHSRIRSDSQGPLMAYELEQLAVVALVWDTSNPRALVADPRGETHVVREGTPIGKNDGLVIHIGDNMVLVKETYVDFAGEMTTNDVELRIRNSQGG